MSDVITIHITSISDGETSFSLGVVTLMDDEGSEGEEAHVTVTPYPLTEQQVLEIAQVVRR